LKSLDWFRAGERDSIQSIKADPVETVQAGPKDPPKAGDRRVNDLSTDPGDLVARIAAGDRAAEAELVRRYGPKIEFILRQRVREASLAADLCQEALIVVIERLRGSGLEQPGKLAAFLRQTAVNLAIGEARTYYRRNTHADSERVDLTAHGAPLMVDLVEQEQLADAIRQLLGELTQARDRQILRRFYLSEEPKPSICASLEVTPEHFDRVLHRARQRFRVIIEARLGPFHNGRFGDKP